MPRYSVLAFGRCSCESPFFPERGRASSAPFVSKPVVSAFVSHSMAPKKGRESVIAKAARLQQEAVRLQSVGKYQMIVKALKAEPMFIQDIYTQLEGMFRSQGRSLPQEFGGEEAADSLVVPKAQGLARGRKPQLALTNGEVGEPGMGADAALETASEVGSEAAERSNKALQSCPASILVALCGGIERVVFSRSALSALKKRGHREPPKGALLELIEFTTGLEPGSNVDISDAGIEITKSQLQALSIRNGRKGLELNLPAEWQRDGVYQLIGVGTKDSVRIRNRFSTVVRKIPEHVLAGHGGENIWIDLNFSEARAVIRSKKGMLSFPVVLLFSGSALDELQVRASPMKPTSRPESCNAPPQKRLRCKKAVGEVGHASASSAPPAPDPESNGEVGVAPPPPAGLGSDSEDGVGSPS